MSKGRSLAALAVLSLLHACGSAPMELRVRTNPPDASVYMDGKLVQKGISLSQPFDFSKVQRICLQATCRGYEPVIQYITERDVAALVESNNDLTINLRLR